MPQAISYTRFSAMHQGKGSTSSRQVGMINDWLSANPGVELSKLSKDDTGKSGFKGDHLNHGLGQILEDIKKGKIKKGDFILVEAVDRIGRLPMLEMFEIIKNIITAEVTVVTLEDNQYYSKETFNNNPSTVFVLIGKIHQAHEYSKNLSRRLIAANVEKRRRARKGETIRRIAPFWLTTEGLLIPERAKIVKECVNLYLSGRGTKSIIESLSLKYPEIKSKHPSTIKRWLKNRALIGSWETKGEVIDNVFEALIDTKTFYSIQRELSKRSKKMSPEQTYHLSGLITCANCGSRFYFRRKNHKGEVIIYANCSTYLKRGKSYCGNNKTWPYEAFKYVMTWGTPELFSFSIYLNQKDSLSEEIENLKFEQQEVDAKIEKLIDALVDMPKQKNLKERLQFMENRRIQIETDITNLEDAILNRKNTHSYVHDKVAQKTNERINEIKKDPIQYREALKETSFRIEVDNDTLNVGMGPNGMELTLLKRSTKHKCYIVKVTTLEHEVFDEETEKFAKIKKAVFYAAIDKKGVKAEDHTEQLLINKIALSDKRILEFINPHG